MGSPDALKLSNIKVVMIKTRTLSRASVGNAHLDRKSRIDITSDN
jgi:hypothetical protein